MAAKVLRQKEKEKCTSKDGRKRKMKVHGIPQSWMRL